MTGQHQLIPLPQLTASPLNHRKHFDSTKMQELEASIRAQGMIVPIIARPIDGERYEVVAGERRFRAATVVGLDTVPAIVRELDDAQALELQVIENNQRVDVLPLEEAEGYEALMKCERAGAASYTVEEIADKIGKSVGYVYGRLKLLALCEAGRKALREEKISASTALLIARIPVPKLQQKCVEEILDGGAYGSDEGMSFREAKEHIENRYMLRLKEAPFKPGDASLVAKAGACTNCEKRTGNQPELFADIAHADVCTDPPCFEAKKKAWAERQREEAIAEGRTVITGKEAKKVLPSDWLKPRGYVRLDDCCSEDPKDRTYRALLGKAAAKPALLERPGQPGEFIEVLPEAEVKAALEKKGYKFASEREERAQRDEKFKRDLAITQEASYRTYLALREAIAREGFGPEDLRVLITEAVGYEEPDGRLLVLWGAESADAEMYDIDEIVKKAPNAQLVPMLLDAIVRDPRHYSHRAADDKVVWEPLAKARGIDRKAIEREVRAEFKAKGKAEVEEVSA